MSSPTIIASLPTDTSNDDRNLGVLPHAAVLASFFFGKFPINLVVPVAIWLWKKDESAFVSDHAKEALNFQITVSIALAVAGMASIVLIGLPFVLAILVADIVCSIQATIAAHRGETYQYPWSLRLIQ